MKKYLKEKKIRLDLKDRKILYELDKDARQPASRIARKVGLSTDGVNYRIKKLLENKVIFKLMTLLDTAKLGFTTYKIFFRFQNTTSRMEKNIINFLKDHPNTQLVTTAEGMFDLNVNVLAGSAEELNTILNEFNNKFGKYIAERQVDIMVKSNFFFRDYFIGKSSIQYRKPMYFGSKPEPVKMDETNKKIITFLAKDARIPTVKIASGIGLSPDAIADRIRKLEKSGVIQNYVLFPNSEDIGYTWNYVMMRFSVADQERERTFFNFCRANQNVWFYSRMIGQWDVVINIETEEHETFKNIMTQIKREFSDIIKEYSILQISKTYKFNQYPMGNV
ncbi:MAG: winged helix-turn-helix transcriptional regulator [Candidatus Aenigmarchaeota archaeon]|nr:winged helix-turn-helix transcriptional regulator [Candidatus Aenigmarchaeota archaeon]